MSQLYSEASRTERNNTARTDDASADVMGETVPCLSLALILVLEKSLVYITGAM